MRKRNHTPISDMYSRRRYRGLTDGSDHQHGPVKVIYSRDSNPVVDPPSKLGLRAGELRREAPECELVFREALESFKLRGVEFQHSVAMHGYIADFYCPSHKLVIELDGPQHRERAGYDRARDAVFKSHGIKTLRFPSVWVHRNLDRILTNVAHELGLL